MNVTVLTKLTKPSAAFEETITVSNTRMNVVTTRPHFKFAQHPSCTIFPCYLGMEI